MTNHERMIAAIKKHVSFGTREGSVSIRRHDRAKGTTYCVGSNAWHPTLEEALLASANSLSITTDGPRDDADIMEALRVAREQLSASEERSRALRSELSGVRAALLPWAKLDDKFALAWGLTLQRDRARAAFGGDFA